jgi:hypothetical protein
MREQLDLFPSLAKLANVHQIINCQIKRIKKTVISFIQTDLFPPATIDEHERYFLLNLKIKLSTLTIDVLFSKLKNLSGFIGIRVSQEMYLIRAEIQKRNNWGVS